MKRILIVSLLLTGCSSLPSWLQEPTNVGVSVSDAGITLCTTIAADLRDGGTK